MTYAILDSTANLVDAFDNEAEDAATRSSQSCTRTPATRTITRCLTRRRLRGRRCTARALSWAFAPLGASLGCPLAAARRVYYPKWCAANAQAAGSYTWISVCEV